MLVFENSNNIRSIAPSHPEREHKLHFLSNVYVNDHELVCAPGISAGRIRFLKSFQ
jgi:hypothetical protein